MHGMEFASRWPGVGVLAALGPQDEMGVVLWDGNERWLFPMQPVGDKGKLGQMIAGMNQGDLPTTPGSRCNWRTTGWSAMMRLKHIIVLATIHGAAERDGFDGERQRYRQHRADRRACRTRIP